MRQLIVQVPRGHGKDVLTIAQKHQGTNLAQIEASNCDRALDLVILHISNHKVEDLLSQLEVTSAIAAILSLLFRQTIATSQMVERSQVSAIAMLLPLAAGAAGALNLVQSERSSLVSGAVAGMLVAASLAPPAGVVGMSIAIGRWDMATGGLFLLLLQLCGINLAAALLFRWLGLSIRGARYSRGKKAVFPITLSITLLALVGLLIWQFINPPNLQRASLTQRANAEIHQVIDQEPSAQLVESNVRFTRSSISGQNTLLAVLYVQRSPNATESDQAIRDRLTQAIQTRLVEQRIDVTPLVSLNVLAPLRQNP